MRVDEKMYNILPVAKRACALGDPHACERVVSAIMWRNSWLRPWSPEVRSAARTACKASLRKGCSALCVDDDAIACHRLAGTLEERKYKERTRLHACEAGHNPSCVTLAARLERVDERIAQARAGALRRLLCDRGDERACGREFLPLAPPRQKTPAAKVETPAAREAPVTQVCQGQECEILRQACRRGNVVACVATDAWGQRRRRKHARALCKKGEAVGCYVERLLTEPGKITDARRALWLKAYAKSCAAGSGRACWRFLRERNERKRVAKREAWERARAKRHAALRMRAKESPLARFQLAQEVKDSDALSLASLIVLPSVAIVVEAAGGEPVTRALRKRARALKIQVTDDGEHRIVFKKLRITKHKWIRRIGFKKRRTSTVEIMVRGQIDKRSTFYANESAESLAAAADQIAARVLGVMIKQALRDEAGPEALNDALRAFQQSTDGKERMQLLKVIVSVGPEQFAQSIDAANAALAAPLAKTNLDQNIDALEGLCGSLYSVRKHVRDPEFDGPAANVLSQILRHRPEGNQCKSLARQLDPEAAARVVQEWTFGTAEHMFQRYGRGPRLISRAAGPKQRVIEVSYHAATGRILLPPGWYLTLRSSPTFAVEHGYIIVRVQTGPWFRPDKKRAYLLGKAAGAWKVLKTYDDITYIRQGPCGGGNLSLPSKKNTLAIQRNKDCKEEIYVEDQVPSSSTQAKIVIEPLFPLKGMFNLYKILKLVTKCFSTDVEELVVHLGYDPGWGGRDAFVEKREPDFSRFPRLP